MGQEDTRSNNGSSLLKGVVIGAAAAAAATLLNSKVRNKVKESAVEVKDSSMKLYQDVKEDPGMVKEKMKMQLQDASTSLKKASENAQELYGKVSNKLMDQKRNFISTSEAAATKEDNTEDEEAAHDQKAAHN